MSSRHVGMWRHSLLPALLILIVGAGCAHLAPRKRASGPVVAGSEVQFTFYSPAAGRVQLAGDWPGNNWARGDGSSGEANIGLMQDDDGDGIWEISVTLEPGRYHYLFLVDEERWRLDPGNPDEVSGGPARLCSQIVLFRRSGTLEMR